MGSQEGTAEFGQQAPFAIAETVLRFESSAIGYTYNLVFSDS